jgi:hypothetical protein
MEVNNSSFYSINNEGSFVEDLPFTEEQKQVDDVAQESFRGRENEPVNKSLCNRCITQLKNFFKAIFEKIFSLFCCCCKKKTVEEEEVNNNNGNDNEIEGDQETVDNNPEESFDLDFNLDEEGSEMNGYVIPFPPSEQDAVVNKNHSKKKLPTEPKKEVNKDLIENARRNLRKTNTEKRDIPFNPLDPKNIALEAKNKRNSLNLNIQDKEITPNVVNANPIKVSLKPVGKQSAKPNSSGPTQVSYKHVLNGNKS